MDRIRVFAYTDRGRFLADRILQIEKSAELSAEKHVCREDFEQCAALVFIGAAGIATRMIAPFVQDKLKDPAVVVVDEAGHFCIPVLSGHMGGANDLARRLAAALGAVPVITTSTDVNGVMAIDELARANGLAIAGRDNIKKVSGGLLKGRPVNIAIADDVVITGSRSDLDEEILGLIYQPLVVGLGMRRGKEFEALNFLFRESLAEIGALPGDVCGLASIDIKKDEPALRQLSEMYHIPVAYYSAEELKKVPGEFETSEFVQAAAGVGDVSARAAKALGVRGSFAIKKKKEDGMTISIFRKYRRITFEY